MSGIDTHEVPGTPVSRPDVSRPALWQFPVPARTVLDNDIELLTYDIPGQYVLSVRLGIPFAPTVEPRDREGVAVLMARLLDEGTERFTGEELARQLERAGVGFGAGVSDVGLGVDVEVVKGNLPRALDLLRQLVTEPSFPQDEVERHVRTRLAEIDQERAVASYRALLEFTRTYFDANHRASRPLAGDRDTVAQVTRDDIVAFHAEQVRSAGTTLVVAGDLAGLDVPGLVADALGDWTRGADRARFVTGDAALAGTRARVVIVDRPGSVQTELLMAAPGPTRSVSGGWAPYPVLSFVLGGSPNARIDAVLREEKGYTYGIRSAFHPRVAAGRFLVTGSVRTEVTTESLELLAQILRDARGALSDKEVRSGADFIGLTAPGRYATADAVADEALGLAMEGRTTAFTTENLRDMASVDAARANAAYERFLDEAGISADGSGWTIVLVGDAAAFAEQVRALGLGEVTVVSDA